MIKNACVLNLLLLLLLLSNSSLCTFIPYLPFPVAPVSTPVLILFSKTGCLCISISHFLQHYLLVFAVTIIFPLFGLPKTLDSSVPRISVFSVLFLLVINSSLFWRSQIISFNQIFQKFLWVRHLRVYAILNILFWDPLRDLLLNRSRIWLFCQLNNMHLAVCSRVFGHFLPFCTRPLRKYSF